MSSQAKMFDFHTHSLLSDGVLLPSEVAVRYSTTGYHVIAITDHADYSNIKQTVNSILSFTTHWPKDSIIRVLPGIELTHLPLNQFKPLAKFARKKGIKVIIGHGETTAEPVIKGTNRAALEADIDILAHPGLITEEDVSLAKKKGIFLEITSRKSHSATNIHVAKIALNLGAKLILNSDSHTPADILPQDKIISNAKNAGLNEKDIDLIFKNTEDFAESL